MTGEPSHASQAGMDCNTVADAVPNDWTARLPAGLRPYAQLARWDRPIGWWLLLWPCWWSVALALNWAVVPGWLNRASWVRLDGGHPTNGTLLETALFALVLFWIGAIAMRGAGCTWNDITDRELDAGVARTSSRPLPSGRVTVRRALGFVIAQLAIGLGVLLSLAALSPGAAPFVIALAFLAVPIIVAYPFAKRVTDWPQLVLGLAFSWGALMGSAVMFGALGWQLLLLYAGCVAWVVGYDTIYAHQDREDDALVGVRSTARLFGTRTKPALAALYGLALLLFAAAFIAAGAHPIAYAGLALAALHMGRQITRLDIDDAGQCLALFRSNTQIGWLVFGGLMAGVAVRLL